MYEVFGRIDDVTFQQARLALESISAKDPATKSTIHTFRPAEWSMYLEHNKEAKQNEPDIGVMIYDAGRYIGGIEPLLQKLKKEHNYTDIRPLPLYKALANTQYKEYLSSTKHSYCFIEIAIDNTPVGRILFELFDDICPKTCKNFASLCQGDHKNSKGHTIGYKGSIIHRVVKKGWIQGGDITSTHGDSGESINGDTFPDENFIMKHSGPGTLGMANKGPHTNASQFYITLDKNEWMNTKYVAFGKVTEGYKILKQIESLATQNDRPLKEVKIQNAGVHKVS